MGKIPIGKESLVKHSKDIAALYLNVKGKSIAPMTILIQIDQPEEAVLDESQQKGC